MPGMSGVDLYRRLRQVRPEQADRLMFVSGALLNPGVDEFMQTLSNPKVDKPFDSAHLRSVVSSMLAR